MARERPASIDRETAVGWLLELCGHDTTTGHEDRGLPALLGILDRLGAEVELQAVADGRSNVLARWGTPRVLLSTHTDTVPPFLSPSRTGSGVRGRGSCDAKGQIVAQLAAIGRLLANGRSDVAWLGVVGEETDSVGATAANELVPRLTSCEAVIVGEPTGCRLATGQRGIAHYRVEVRGRAAHSATPDRGRNALFLLLDWMQALRAAAPGFDEELGAESWNLARINGGTRANIVPDRAVAELLARTIPGSRFDEQLRASAPEGATVDLVQSTPPARFPAIEGFERTAVPFGSDAPRLRGLSSTDTVILAGPGRIEVAHSDHEELLVEELEAGIELNRRLVQRLSDGGDGGSG